MNPAVYPAAYLALPVWLEDGTYVLVQIKNYLQSGMGQQSSRAQAAKAVLVRKLTEEFGVKGSLPKLFELEGSNVARLSIDRVFMGKGAPDEIQDTLWLASRYGLLDQGSIQNYCDLNVGIDCGGFVACLWGMGRPVNGNAVDGSTGFLPRYFWNMNKSMRRTDASKILVGDAIIFFKHMKGDDTDAASTNPALGGEAYHIGAVGGIRVNANSVDLGIMESSGAPSYCNGNGVNYRIAYNIPTKTGMSRGQSLVYGDAGNTVRLYFVGKTTNVTPYLPYGWAGDDGD